MLAERRILLFGRYLLLGKEEEERRLLLFAEPLVAEPVVGSATSLPRLRSVVRSGEEEEIW